MVDGGKTAKTIAIRNITTFSEAQRNAVMTLDRHMDPTEAYFGPEFWAALTLRLIDTNPQLGFYGAVDKKSNKPVGMAAVYPCDEIDPEDVARALKNENLRPDEAGYVPALVVHPNYRNRGISHRLMAAVENHARQGNLAAILGMVRHDNVASKKLLESRGWKKVDDVMPGGVAAHIYALRLRPV